MHDSFHDEGEAESVNSLTCKEDPSLRFLPKYLFLPSTGMTSRRRSSSRHGDGTQAAGNLTGTWYEESAAAAKLGIDVTSLRRNIRQGLALNCYREYGRDVHAPEKYRGHYFVYFAPEGTEGSRYPISLASWAGVCNALGDDGKGELSVNQKAHFEQYLGIKHNEESLKEAIGSGRLLLRSNLPKAGDSNESEAKQLSSSPTDSESASSSKATEVFSSQSATSSTGMTQACIGLNSNRVNECRNFEFMLNAFEWSKGQWRSPNCLGECTIGDRNREDEDDEEDDCHGDELERTCEDNFENALANMPLP